VSQILSRADGRNYDALRPITIETKVQRNPEGSVMITCGGTKVLVSASVEEGVKDFLRGSGKGWITAEYSMHPRANPERNRRERQPPGGRTQEIQRLIGRALRASVNLDKLGERTIHIDCDVLDADGGTRTTSVTGGYVALVLALDLLRKRGSLNHGVLRDPVAAVSVGLVSGAALLDLCYAEDSTCQVDFNLVATSAGDIIEVQGTAEGAPMTRAEHDKLVERGIEGIRALVPIQLAAIEQAGVEIGRLRG
jgi:ribonuclease PH